MKIANSSIGMESERVYTAVRMDAYLRMQSSVSLSARDFINSLTDNLKKGEKEEKVEEEDNKENLKNNSQDNLEYLKGKFNELATVRANRNNRVNNDTIARFRAMCIKYILMLLLGEDFKDLFEMTMGGGGPQYVATTTTSAEMHYFSEEESTTYKAQGKVVTEDGREIDFGIDLVMSRSFEEYYEKTVESTSIGQQLLDPLIINFDGNIADVKDQKFIFDINSDGVDDEVAMVSSGSGFLAYDKNNDGEINDGNELFGTKSGDGFRDLAQYDLDRNGWIDENDDIFHKLKIMAVNEDGTKTLYSLKEKGVGAIYLGNTDTHFSLTNQETNNVNANIRKTGILLYENGSAGTVQHVDLAVSLGA